MPPDPPGAGTENKVSIFAVDVSASINQEVPVGDGLLNESGVNLALKWRTAGMAWVCCKSKEIMMDVWIIGVIKTMFDDGERVECKLGGK